MQQFATVGSLKFRVKYFTALFGPLTAARCAVYGPIPNGQL